MRSAIRRLATDDQERQRLADNGLETIRNRHTCDNRAEQLLDIYNEIGRE